MKSRGQEWRGKEPSPKMGPRGTSLLASSLPFSSCAPVTLSVTRARERDWLASLLCEALPLEFINRSPHRERGLSLQRENCEVVQVLLDF